MRGNGLARFLQRSQDIVLGRLEIGRIAVKIDSLVRKCLYIIASDDIKTGELVDALTGRNLIKLLDQELVYLLKRLFTRERV